MGTIILLLVVVVAVIAIRVVLKAKSQGGDADEAWPFYAKKPLSQPEQVLYFRLVQALPEHIVLAQVQLSRLLGEINGDVLNFCSWPCELCGEKPACAYVFFPNKPFRQAARKVSPCCHAGGDRAVDFIGHRWYGFE